ncbi:hypothetical protein BC629DRAFT_1589970 [Irpex lacteus]|nr:hypothetical protein BC629DRAFT_1589970 [Irpex lacteus]
MSDLPPLYTSASAQPHALPVYSQCATPTERVLHTTASEPTASTRNLTRQFVFSSDHLEIDFGKFPCALMHPAYGIGGVVEGTVKVKSRCTYVSQLTIKLEGVVTTTASEYAHVAIAGLHTFTLFSKTVQLVPERGDSSGATHTLEVGTTTLLLSPSHRTSQKATPSSPVSMSHAKACSGRHEVRKIPVLFLPKSRPAMPAMYELPRAVPQEDSYGLPERVKETVLSPTWPETCQAQAIAEVTNLPIVKLWSPIPQQYASGDFIPLAVNISCPSSPALTKLYASNVEIQLVKRRRIWFAQERMPVTTHFIRVTVRPPADVRHLPTFKIDEPIELTTDPYEDPETVLLTEDHAAPALGLTTLRPQCAQLSLTWT